MLVSRIALELGATAKAFPSRFFGTLFFLMRNSRLAGSCISMFIPISDPSTIWTCFFRNCMACVVYSCCCMCFGGANGGEPKLFALHHGFVPRAGDALSTFLPITMADTKNPRQQKSWQSLPQKWQIDFWHVLKWLEFEKICFMFGDSKCFVKPCQMNFWGSLLFTHPTWCCEGNHPVDDIL